MTSDVNPTRWGIAACGKISHDFVACLRTLPDHQVIACASSSSLENAQKFAAEHIIPTAHGSYEELSKNSYVEVVYIGTIHPAHFKVAKLMLENGKHILVEKPMGMNSNQVKRIYELAREKKLFAMEAMWSRFLPTYQHMIKEIKNGAIGEPKQVVLEMGLDVKKLGIQKRLLTKSLGGGITLDMGVYILSFALTVFGYKDIVQISAVGNTNGDGCDTAVTVTLKYGDGKLANLVLTTEVQLSNQAMVYGTQGTILMPAWYWTSPVVRIKDNMFEFPFPDTAAPCNYPNSSGLRYEAMEVRKCLQNGLLESLGFSQEESTRMHEIMDEMRRQLNVVYLEDLEPQI